MWVRAGPLVLIFLLILISPVYGANTNVSWEYFVDHNHDSMIDMSQTTAEIDYDKKEITLKKILPKSVDLYEDEMDYVVLSPNGFTHYSFNGDNMQENSFLGVTASNPLAVCTSSPYPDAVLYNQNENKIIHYSFTGTEMSANPTLTVSNIDNVISIGTRNLDVAFIQDNKLEYHGFTGEDLVCVFSQELTNPIDFALFPDSYNMAIIDDDKIKYLKNGSEILNLLFDNNKHKPVNPISITVTEIKTETGTETGIAVVDATVNNKEVKHYKLSGDKMTYINALSITGLTNPRCVAIKPGTQDRIVIDGNQVKYYSYDGTNLIYNPKLSTTVTNLETLFRYNTYGVVVSTLPDKPKLERDIYQARVRAYCYVPIGTSITWSLTIDDVNWVKCWEVIGTETGLGDLYAYKQNAEGNLVWSEIGGGNLAYTENDEPCLTYTSTVPNRKIKWKAELKGTRNATPKIWTKASYPAILLDVNNKPTKPDPDPENEIPNPGDPNNPSVGSCMISPTPTLKWNFNDPDFGDTQSGFRIQILTYDGIHGNGVPVCSTTTDSDIKSGNNQVIEILSENPGEAEKAKKWEYTIPPDVLFQSGKYNFEYRIRTRDKGGLWSDLYSDWEPFCVVAFEYPRINKIVHPSATQPDSIKALVDNLKPNDPSTFIEIIKGWETDKLPRTKAGGKVGLLVNGIGLNADAIKNKIKVFYYDSVDKTNKDTIFAEGHPKIDETKGTNNKFLIEFHTSSNPKVCPDGTVIQGRLEGSYNNSNPIVIFSPDKNLTNYYADGIATIEGTVLKDWMVVLQGRKNS